MKQLKYIFVVFFLVVPVSYAERGPFYIYSEGFCNIKELFVTNDDFLYAREIGCPGDFTIYSGNLGDTRVTLGYSWNNDQRLAVYDLFNGIETIYSTDGSAFFFVGENLFSIDTRPPVFSRKRQSLPSVNDPR